MNRLNQNPFDDEEALRHVLATVQVFVFVLAFFLLLLVVSAP